MNKRLVARITIEAPVTSFRYPHFLVGRQITFDMPPPSTIYGHVASAVGDLLDPVSFQFAYDFRFRSKSADLEHQHIISAGGARFEFEGAKYVTSVQGVVQPHVREFLFHPRLTLYLDDLRLADSFRHPVFCVILGRSQDLAAITHVEEVELEVSDGAYLEHTLAPYSLRPHLGVGSTVLMPRYIGPPPERTAQFERYVVLHERVFSGSVEGSPAKSRMLATREAQQWWVDPDSPIAYGVHRAVVFHPFVEASQ